MTKPLTAEQLQEMQKAQTERAERQAAGLPPLGPSVDTPARPIEKAEGRRPYTINLRPVDQLAARSWALRHRTTLSGLISGLIKDHLIKMGRSGEMLNSEELAPLSEKERAFLQSIVGEEIDKI